jgi:hypothetical protein
MKWRNKMGKTLTRIPFFSDEITIIPHTSTSAEYLGKKVTIAEFAGGRPVALSKIDGSNEYVAVKYFNDKFPEFMEGPEA